MQQILQNLHNGTIELTDIPCPKVKPNTLLIKTLYSLVSPGTERMLIEFGKANLLNKARQQPDKVKMVIDKIKTDGFISTISAVKSKLNQPIPLGYCNFGVVLEIGAGVDHFAIGDRVVSNGNHAEVVCVPKNLCAKVPDNVNNEAAAFTVLSAIALQGIRLAKPTLGESFAVIGLGPIGLLTIQLLKANGCRVLGIDYNQTRLTLAKQFGADIINLNNADPFSSAEQFSKYRGVDGVLITAATKSNDPVHQAAQMCRKRGRIILVGVTGLSLSRDDFYKKELSLQVSCSYGPGRYDKNYEDNGQDYPIGFVRWTEQRNFETILDLLANHKLDITPLISHQIDFANATKAYELLAQSSSLGILLKYSSDKKTNHILQTPTIKLSSHKQINTTKPSVGFIGAGNYANKILIPAFNKAGVLLKSIATNQGISGSLIGKKFNFINSTTDVNNILHDPSIDIVVIATQHNSHADLICKALQAKKHVFVEKPLCITIEQLKQIEFILQKHPQQLLMVGFNRRFSPLIKKIKTLIDGINQPKSFIMTVNAGKIPKDHWTQDLIIGGGRIIGEACHFVDLLRYLANNPITAYQVTQIGPGVETRDDKVTLNLNFADGSHGSIHYFANGHKSFPKERLEIFCDNKILQLNNFKKLIGFGWPSFKKMYLFKQDKGQKHCVQTFVNAIKTEDVSPIPINELFEVGHVIIEMAQQLKR